MKSVVPNLTMAALTACALIGGASPVFSQSQVYVDPGQTWLGYMNWFENNGGTQGDYAGGGAWGTADLPADFSGGVLGLAPNINVYDPNDSYWVNPDGTGAKWMDANFYVENPALAGQTLTFSGSVLNNSLVSPYTSVAFIKEFTTSYVLVQSQTAGLVGGQGFTVSLTSTPGNIIQYGFETMGPDANPATVDSLGSVSVVAVPEPSVLALIGLAILSVPFQLRRRQKR